MALINNLAEHLSASSADYTSLRVKQTPRWSCHTHRDSRFAGVIQRLIGLYQTRDALSVHVTVAPSRAAEPGGPLGPEDLPTLEHQVMELFRINKQRNINTSTNWYLSILTAIITHRL